MTLSGISELPLFKRHPNRATEVEALIDLLPYPTLIFDQRSGRILYANAQASQLTAYTRKEFLELNVGTLLPEYKLKEKNKSEQNYTLIKRNSNSVSVTIKPSLLGGPEQWTALTIRAFPPKNESREFDEGRWEALLTLSRASQQEELASCFRQILQAASLLTGASHLLLYTKLGDSLHLEAVMGSGVEFPIHLEQKEVAALKLPKVWQPGKAIESILQKSAHAAKLAFLASTPLDQTHPESGLLVAAGVEPASKDMLNMLQIVAASVTTAAARAVLQTVQNKDLQLLIESEELNSVLRENMQDGLIVTDGRLTILEINPAGETMLGYQKSEVEGRAASDILISGQTLLADLEKTVLENKPVDMGKLKLLRRDGSEFLALLRLVPVENTGDKKKLTILISDLSEHEAFHVQSQQLQQRAWLGEVTAIFAHEVRNPINNISTGLQLMQLNLPEQDPLQEQIKRLQEDCDRLDHRMRSVLSFSRSLDHNPEPIDMAEFCQQQLDRWRPRLAHKGIHDHLQVATNTPPVYGDRRALDQVFTNLITNAIQALDGQENGFLAIKVGPDSTNSDMVDIRISDNGPGIPEDLRRRVFEPFFTTKENEGTGLGLAITRRIVMAHKGEIDLESFPGGTLFKIQLPIAPLNSKPIIEAR